MDGNLAVLIYDNTKILAENTPVKINSVTLEPPTVKRNIILNVTTKGEQCIFW